MVMLEEHPQPRVNPDRDTRNPFTSRGFLISATVIVVILGLLIWLVVGGTKSHRHSLTKPTQAAAPAVRGTSIGGSTCNVSPGDQTVPESAPAGVTWQIIGYIAFPSSKAAGPEVVTGDIARCFAHSPLGALIAMVQIDDRVAGCDRVCTWTRC
jgi:cytoskeletal protein RodZ